MPTPRSIAVLLSIGMAGCANEPTIPSNPLPEARIAFAVRWPKPDSMPLYTVRADGSDLRQVLAGEGERYGPTWSPDRAALAFAYSRFGLVSEFEIRVVGADGSGERTILGPGDYSEPAWAPASDRIALSEGMPDGSRRLVTISATGSNLTAIGQRHAYDRSPAWSPDGARLAFVSNCLAAGCDPAVSDLWVVNADGSAATQLTAGAAIDDDAESPTWSADGAWIAFAMNRGGVSDVYRIRPTGADLEKLTAGTTLVRYGQPAYSPDGAHLAFTKWVTATDIATPLYVAGADGSTPLRLPLSAGEPVDPAWAR